MRHLTVAPSPPLSSHRENDKRACLDHALRRRVSTVAEAAASASAAAGGRAPRRLRAALQLSVSLARAERCSPTTPIVLLADAFDALPLDGAQALFSFVEDNVATWKEEMFFNACKNNLLRMCNGERQPGMRGQWFSSCGVRGCGGGGLCFVRGCGVFCLPAKLE